MTKLQSPNFHVSKTGFVIYNLLKSMTKKELKQFCVNAVTYQATKQKPVIRQFLKTVKKGKVVIKNQSRGVAFDQFLEHQHALGVLRVLNNNPETFGPEHRPVVEFAVDNMQTLKLRKAKLQAQQQDASDDSNNAHQNAESHLICLTNPENGNLEMTKGQESIQSLKNPRWKTQLVKEKLIRSQS